MSAWQILQNGGPLMWPIVICSLVGLALFIERVFYFSSVSTDVYALKSKVFDLLKQNRLKDAIVLCEQNPSVIAKMMKAGIAKFGSSRHEIKEALESAGSFEIALLEKNLPPLLMITHLVPLLGLLGTVTGLAVSFYSIQVRSAAMNPVTPGDIAGGMWQALLTTIFGLIVAIPALLAYNYCVGRVGSFVLDMERTATEINELLVQLSQSNSQ